VKLLKRIGKKNRSHVLQKEQRHGRVRAEDAVVRAKETYDRQVETEARERAYIRKQLKEQEKIQEREWRAARYGARFRQRFTLEDAIEFHAFAPLEALPCVLEALPCVRPMIFRVHSSYRLVL
jgi:hypothetical protein